MKPSFSKYTELLIAIFSPVFLASAYFLVLCIVVEAGVVEGAVASGVTCACCGACSGGCLNSDVRRRSTAGS